MTQRTCSMFHLIVHRGGSTRNISIVSVTAVVVFPMMAWVTIFLWIAAFVPSSHGKDVNKTPLHNQRLRAAERSLLGASVADGTTVASHVRFGHELVLRSPASVAHSGAEEGRAHEEYEQVWEHLVLRDHNPTSATAPSLGASSLSHACQGVARALNAPPAVLRWLDDLLTSDGTGEKDSANAAPLGFLSFSALSPATVLASGDDGADSGAAAPESSLGPASSPSAARHDSALVLEVPPHALQLLADALRLEEETGQRASAGLSGRDDLSSSPSSASPGQMLAIRLSWFGGGGGASNIASNHESVGAAAAAASGVTVVVGSSKVPLPTRSGSYSDSPTSPSLLGSPPSASASASLASVLSDPRLSHWALGRTSAWALRFHANPSAASFALENSASAAVSTASTAASPAASSGVSTAASFGAPASALASDNKSSSSGSLLQHEQTFSSFNELRVWFSSNGNDATRNGDDSGSGSDIANLALLSEGLGGGGAADNAEAAVGLATVARHLDELGTYRGLCATGTSLGTDWVEVEPLGCDSWEACDSFLDCTNSAVEVGTCLCCAPGANQAGYVRTDSEYSICPCPAGTNGLSGICEDCTSGSGFLGSCAPCAAGRYAGLPATGAPPLQCAWCPDGQYASSASTEVCPSCAAGQYSSLLAGLNMTSCADCEAGSYSGPTAGACTPCTAGMFAESFAVSGVLSSSCTPCPSGSYATGTGNSECTSCAVGTYATGSAAACASCASGKYSSSTGSSSCSPCGVGTYAAGTGSSGCTDCSSGTANANSAQPSCTDCGTGQYSASSGQETCDECAAGTYAIAGQSACVSCAAGTYSGAAAGLCTSCSSGKVALSTGQASCADCGAGTYAAGTGNSGCEDCGAGASTGGLSGQGSCAVCLEGWYAASTGTASCSACATGSYSSSTAQTSCVQCGAGKYSASTAASACDSCAAGTSSTVGSVGCTACGVGTYAASTGSTGCTDCAGGKYIAATSASSCSSCQAGKYSSAGSTGCTACYPGTYSGDESSSCTPCASGKYSGVFESQFCTDCPSGTSSASSGAFSCDSCFPGYYATGGAVACTECAAGLYSASFTSSSCTFCAAGWYASFPTASYSCTACVGGFYAANPGTVSCGGCATGKYSSSGAASCTDCAAGRYGPITASAFCSLCPGGKYSELNSIQCTSCPKGKAAATEGLAFCSNCTAGSFTSRKGRISCTLCPGGQYQGIGGKVQCEDCPAGFFSQGPGNTTCGACPGGRTSAEGDSECENDCAAGTYLQEESCINCPSGKFSYKGDFACTTCERGRYSPASTTPNACTLSPAGYHVENEGQNHTEICSAGKYSGSGAYQCESCMPGYFSVEGSAFCGGTCQAGTYSIAGSFECTLCPAGRGSVDASPSCTLCPCGKYTVGVGEPQCLSCGAGKYTNNYRTGCYNCPSGTYQVITSTYCYCHWCATGKYGNSVGNFACTSCDAGKWSSARSGSCTSCLPGYYAPSAGAIGCTVCALGQYAPALASAGCTTCPAGKLSFTAEFECRDCPAGTYSDPGLSYCIYCNNGTYSGSAGSGSCDSCEPGRYAGGQGAFTSCTLCSKGHFTPLNGSKTCETCAAGKFSKALGSEACLPCAAGYFCKQGATKDKEYSCVNITSSKPESFYCPEGSSQRNSVPPGWFSEPLTEISKRNRESVSKCSKTTTCLHGIEYSNFFWFEGNCADGALDSSARVSKTLVEVDEATDGLPVGTVQAVLSPFPVEFFMDPASSYANGGPFELKVIGNGSSFQIDVRMPPGGLDFETVNAYHIGLTAVSNGTTINCSMAVEVVDVNEKPTIVLGSPPVRNVSEAAIANEYLSGAPIQALDPDTKDEHVYSLVSSEPPEGMEFFGIGGCSGRLYAASEGLNVLAQDEYNLTIRVRDDASPDPLQDFGNLTVKVLNANDAPYFLLDPSDIRCEVPENSAENTSVSGLNCSGGVPWGDPDVRFGDYVVWEISRADVDDSFEIDRLSGELFVSKRAELDFEEQDQYSIEITMTDTGGLSESMDLIVYVTNVNEPPTSYYPTLFVFETAGPGFVVCRAAQVSTDDPDSSVFSYSLVQDGNASAFNISSASGELSVSHQGLDYETRKDYRLTVVTTDSGLDDGPDAGLNSQSSTTAVHVTVLDVNEAPTLAAAEAYFVDEDALQGSVVGYMYVDDPDEGQAHSFTLSQGSSGVDFFTVAASTQEGNRGRGVLLVSSATELVFLDFETQPLLALNVTTSDGALSDTKTVLVHVNNSNDNPVCPALLATSIAEGEVGALRAYDNVNGFPNSYEAAWNFTDEDAFSLGAYGWGQLNVSTSTVGAGGQFDVSGACELEGCPDRRGRFTLLTPLDFETTPTTSFQALATDGGGLVCQTEVSITVTNVNDAPFFDKKTLNATYFVPDTIADGESVGLVAATDPDASTSSFGLLSYAVFTPSDPCPDGPNGTLVSVAPGGTFSVVSTTGELRIANGDNINYPGQLCVGVRVSDGGTPSLTAEAVVTVITVDQNSPPSIANQPLRVLVPEDTPSFTNLLRINGSDSDPGNGLSYAISSCVALYSTYLGGGAWDNGTLPCGARIGMFSVVSVQEGGVPMDAWLRLETSQLNYEDSAVFGTHRPPTFQLTVTVTDDPVLLSPLSTSATVTVVVADVAEPPSFESSSFSMLESSSVGTAVGSVAGAAQDEDADSTLTFSLDRHFSFSAAKTYDQCKSFCISQGLQTVCLDSSEKQASLVTQYQDPHGGNGSLANLWVGFRRSGASDTPFYGDFLWESPGCVAGYLDWQVGQPSSALTSYSSNGKNCASMDLDEAGAWQDNQCSSKPSAGDTECVCEPGPFDINENGTVFSTGTLDYERLTDYSLVAVVTDETGLSTYATVDVSIVDVPEPPIIYPDQVFSVEENTPRGSIVGQILASDDDANGEIEFELLNGTDVFSVSQGEGSLLAGGTNPGVTLDFECTNSYVLLVRATSDSQAVERTISVVLTDVNDVTVTSVTYGLGLSTLGGDVVSLVGTNFGPCGGDPSGDVTVRATYTNGLDGLTYDAASCAVSPVQNTLITCTSAPGVGSKHEWNVTVDSTLSSFQGGLPALRSWAALSGSGATTSYAQPTVTSVSGASLMSTSGSGGGSNAVVLTGTNFPPYACASAQACGGLASRAWQLSRLSMEVAIRWEDSGWASVTGSSTGGSFLDVSCVSLVVSVGGTEALCAVGAGVGADLYWGVTVGASGVPSVALESGLTQFAGTGFAPPAITLLSSSGAFGSRSVYDLSTSGGDFVLLTGANFGNEFESLAGAVGVAGLSAPGLVVTYGPAGSEGTNADWFDGNAEKYSAFECEVVGDHFEILCQTVAGVGANLTWRVGIAGQWGSSQCVGGADLSRQSNYSNCLRNATTSYASPVVTPGAFGSSSASSSGSSSSFGDSTSSLGNAVTGAGAVGASTQGGQQIIIAGTEFGPSAEVSPPVVTYGPSPLSVQKYVAVDCVVSVDYSQLRCLTNEGVGKGLWVQVAIGGQRSVPYQANVSYSNPNVAEYTPSWENSDSGLDEGARTQGGQWIIIKGRNFGSVAENALTEVRYQSSSKSDTFTETFYPCQSVSGVGLGPYYNCPTGSPSGPGQVQKYEQPSTCLVLTGVVDGPSTGSKPVQAVELFAACDVSDLSSYSLGKVTDPTSSNGQGSSLSAVSSSFQFPEGSSVRAGEFLYVAHQEAGFAEFFGFAPDFWGTVAAQVDGDDALLLSRTGVGVVDVLGTLNASAASAGWGYQDGWVYRLNGTTPSSDARRSAMQEGWSTGHENALGSFATNADATAAGVGFPLGSYSPQGWDPAAGCDVVDPCSCQVVVDHVAINCSTVPGAGTGHAWVVSVANQESTAATTSYGVPSVLALSGAGAMNASTYGNEAVTLSGVNFGPQSGAGPQGNASFLGAVTYGPGGSEYEATNCQITVPHTEIVCFTVAGVGATLHWVVSVDGQASLASEPTSGYATPHLLGLFAQRVDTQGGTVHVLNGTNLGMASPDAFLQVFVDGLPLYVDGESLQTVFPQASVFMASKLVSGWSSSSENSSSPGNSPYWEALSLVMPPLEDEDHHKEVVVEVGHRRFGGALSLSNVVAAVYKPPRLSEVQNSPGGQEGTRQVSDLILKGDNFGSVGAVLLGGEVVDPSRIGKWRDDQITLSVVADSGNITVVVGAYETETIDFDDFSPILFGTLAGFVPDPEGYRTDAKAELSDDVSPLDFDDYSDYVSAVNAGKGQGRNLSLAGAYFGSIESVLEVTVGDPPHRYPCHLWPGSLRELPIVATEIVRAVKCQLPPGAGLQNRVVLSRSQKSSFVSNASQQLYVDYHEPTVTGVAPKRVHTSGGDVVALSGRNFGTFSRAGVEYGGGKIPIIPETFSPTYMEVVVPAGDGVGQPLSVTVAGQADTVYSSAEQAMSVGGLSEADVLDPSFVLGFSYFAPNVSAIAVPAGGLSTLGGAVTVTGTDLGLPGSLTAVLVRAASDDAAAGRRLSGGEFDPSQWVTLDYSVVVVNSTHDSALILIGQGEGANELLVNVSGQVSLTPLAYAAPSLVLANPSSVPTSGGANVTLTGLNFGLGTDFEISLAGPAGAGAYCSHVWTDADVGTSVLGYDHSKLWFLTPEGQCDEGMTLTLEVAGQLSNTLAFSFAAPAISMLSLDGSSALGSNCVRSSTKGCGLDTTGGYKVTVTGDNFGLVDRSIRFRGNELLSEDVEFFGHTEASFVVPPGTGSGISVEVVVGGRTSVSAGFSYDPPWVTSFTPNEFDANDDLIEIYGRNFGQSVEDAGAIAITIGNRTCVPVTVGTAPTTIWQKTVNDVPYLWCHLSGSTVGRKDLKLFVAGQNLTRDEDGAGIRGVCQSGFYGQEAWTVYTNSDVECEMECADAQVNGQNFVSSEAGGGGSDAQACTAFYDSLGSPRGFRLELPFTEDSEQCVDEWSCMRNAELPTGEHSNCTILTRENEYCTQCPLGSVCDDFTTLYSVEPISVEGYWRDAVKEGDPEYPQFRCDPLRDHRPYCWDFQPCSPTEACKGDNTCLKGYTLNKCSECCDQRFGYMGDGPGGKGSGPKGKNPDCWSEDFEDQILFHRIYGKCEKCPENILFLAIGALLFLIVAVLTGRRMQKKKVDLGIFSIGIDYFQVLAVFASTEVEWPESVQYMFRIFSLFNFSINLTPPECAFTVTYERKWLVVEWTPTVLFAAIALGYFGSRYYFRYCTSKSSRKAREVRNSMIAGSLLLMYVLYLNISENTLDPLNCRRILAEDGSKSDRHFMVSQPAEVCWEEKFPTMQQRLAPFAYTFFFLYTVGYPLLVCFILLRPSNREKCMNDQYLRCMGTGSRRETNKGYFNHRTKFATLYFKFKPKYYFWILLIIFRKLCIVTFTLLFHVNATMQLSMILLVIFLSYTAQIKYCPYLSRDNYEDILGEMGEEEYQGLVGPYGSCPQPKGIGYDAMLEEKALKGEYALTRVSTMGTIQDKLSKGQGMTRDDFKAAGSAFLKVLFDYNTVEAVLLFCAILVCLFGIMFASEFSGPGELLYERLGELTLAVIGVSIAYYMLVVWTEVVAVMFPSLKLSFVSGAVEGNRDQVEMDQDGNVVDQGKDLTGLDDSDEEVLEAASALGLDHTARDEYLLSQLERDVVYVKTNPIVEREMADQLSHTSKQDRGSVGGLKQPSLLGVEEQVALQETVEKLMQEVKELKKKEALGGGEGGGGAEGSMKMAHKKKAKHKIGGGAKSAPNGGGGKMKESVSGKGVGFTNGGEDGEFEDGATAKRTMKSMFGGSGKKKAASVAEALRETVSGNLEFGYNVNDDDSDDGDFGGSNTGSGPGGHSKSVVKLGSANKPSFQTHTNPLMAMQRRQQQQRPTAKPAAASASGGGGAAAEAGGAVGDGFVYPLGRTASTLDIEWDGTDGQGGKARAVKNGKAGKKGKATKKAVKMAAEDFDDDGAL